MITCGSEWSERPVKMFTGLSCLICKQKPLNFVSFPKVFVGTIWCMWHVTVYQTWRCHGIDRQLSQKFEFYSIKGRWNSFNFTLLTFAFYIVWVFFIAFCYLSANFNAFWRLFKNAKNQKIADSRWPPFRNHDVMSSSCDLKRTSFEWFFYYFCSVWSKKANLLH